MWLLWSGCGDRQPSPDNQTSPESSRNDAEVVTPARYLSALAFAGAVSGGSTLYLELLNESVPGALIRDYRGWFAEEDRWREILRIRDTLPVPRAAWRILPGDGLDVLVGDGPEMVGLVLTDSSRRLRLLPGRVIAEWAGPTGQRELLAHASLAHDSVSEPGFLFLRRAARPVSAPVDLDEDEFFLLVDTRGNGFLVARTDTITESAGAVAWSWFNGIPSNWLDVTLQPNPADTAAIYPAGSPGWTLEIPSASLTAEFRSIGERPGFVLVSGTLFQDGEPRELHGIQLLNRLP